MNDEAVKKELGAEIKRRRIAAGWSQQQFASMLGMNRTRLREIENGTGNPQLSTLFRVSDGLSVPLPALFGVPESNHKQ